LIVKKCFKCKIEKPLDQFRLLPNRPGKRESYCRPCTALRVKEWRAGKNSIGRHPRKLGVDQVAYDAILQAQNGGCAGCGVVQVERRLCVDHDHVTGRVRGLLCGRCNLAIGSVRDDPATLRHLANYLEAATKRKKRFWWIADPPQEQGQGEAS
jgi:hypothetical protein